MLREKAASRLIAFQFQISSKSSSLPFGSTPCSGSMGGIYASSKRHRHDDVNGGATATAAAPRGHSNQHIQPVYICSAARTPLGSFQGSLSHLTATELGAIAIRAAVERAGVPPSAVGEVFMGNVCSANLGQAPARQAALAAGLSLSTDCTAVNKVCSSGLKAVALGAQAVALGVHDVVLAGGMESMSRVPYYSDATRTGARMGHVTLVDGLLRDGLIDAIHGVHMGECADECAAEMGISREAQDAHAIESAARARRAREAVAWEIVPVPKAGKKSGTSGANNYIELTQDEAVSKNDPEKLRRLSPYFVKDGSGTVTAGNSSPITDGAAAVVLASAQAVQRYNLPVLGRIAGFADAAQEPKKFATSPALAVPKALAAAGLTKDDVDYYEINEAFSVVDLANQKLLGLHPDRVNVLGGSVAIGHPIGASGARILVTLLNVLRIKEDGRVGVAAICNAGGGASAMVIVKE